MKAEDIRRMEEVAKLELVLNADGTYELKGPNGKGLKSTYTASGNTLTLNPAENNADKNTQTLVYNEADQTLTNAESKTTVLKKK